MAGKNGLKTLYAELPFSSTGVWYRDEIGNISTSHAWKDRQNQIIKLEIEPRFPVLGGWKSNWEIGYNLKTTNYVFE